MSEQLNQYSVIAKTKEGRVFKSYHATMIEAQASANCLRGKYPYGRRVSIEFNKNPK